MEHKITGTTISRSDGYLNTIRKNSRRDRFDTIGALAAHTQRVRDLREGVAPA
jgi:hypothetical protein